MASAVAGAGASVERDVPLAPSVAAALRAHSAAYKPVRVSLPWRRPDGPVVTHSLFFAGLDGGVTLRNDFNRNAWKPALVAAGVLPEPQRGQEPAAARHHGMHALRHFFASVLLDAGESIKAVAEYLGHSDPALTLRVYAHLMPTTSARSRRAIDAVFRAAPNTSDGP